MFKASAAAGSFGGGVKRSDSVCGKSGVGVDSGFAVGSGVISVGGTGVGLGFGS